MKTLVLSQRFTDDSNLLWRAAVSAGWDVVRAHGLRVDSVGGEPVLYGETIFADAVAEQLGVSVLGPPDGWLPSLSRTYLHRDVGLQALKDVLEGAFPVFAKPPDDKFFAASVYKSPDELLEVTGDYDPAALVLVSTPVCFEVEYRAFVHERKVIALSVYIRGGSIAQGWEEQPGERDDAMDLLNAMLADPAVDMPPVMVIDVGRLSTGLWAVVEGNPAWASGLCNCDPAAVLMALAAATVVRGSGGKYARDAVWAA